MTQIMKSAGPCRVPPPLFRDRHGDGSGMRMLLVAGLRGDDLSGVHALGLFRRRLVAAASTTHGALRGTLDLYPVAHPMGLDGIGRSAAARPEELELVLDVLAEQAAGAALCVHLTTGTRGLDGLPQLVVGARDAEGLSLARWANVDAVRVRREAPAGSLTARLERAGVPTVELRLGLEPDPDVLDRQVARGLLGVASRLGILEGGGYSAGLEPPRAPVFREADVEEVWADTTGIFVPSVNLGDEVWPDEPVGRVVDPRDGTVALEMRAPQHGLVLELRRVGVVRPGERLALVGAYSEH